MNSGSVASKQVWQRSELKMGTIVNMKVVSNAPEAVVGERVDEAFALFSRVEQACSRFDETSELRRLLKVVGEPIPVSGVLYQATKFALAVAEHTGGAFDPTIGRTMLDFGYDKHYLTGETGGAVDVSEVANYSDVVLDEEAQTIVLNKPLLLDLGAVAKGYAVDLAAKVLESFDGFVIDAGGDIFVGGQNEYDEPWIIGIRHPVVPDDILVSFRGSGLAVCTSGGYERPSPAQAGAHHLIDPRTKKSQKKVVSATVVAPFAMMADAFSTAAFILGCKSGVALLEEAGVEGLLVDPALKFHYTKGMEEYIHGAKA